MTQLAEPQTFEVERLYEGSLPGKSDSEIASFRAEMNDLIAQVSTSAYQLDQAMKKVDAMETALARSSADMTLYKDIYRAKMDLNALDLQLNGNKAKAEIGERDAPTIRNRMFIGYRGLSTNYGPTPNHRQSIEIAKQELADMNTKLMKLVETELPRIEKALQKAGAPLIEGQVLPGRN